jgi:hypothetical protein
MFERPQRLSPYPFFPAMSMEEEAVLLSVQFAWDGTQRRRFLSLLSDPAFKWDQFWHVADEQQVVPLAARCLTSPEVVASLPGPIVDQAKQSRFVWLAHALGLHAELQRLMQALKSCGIPVAPLKGTALAERLYGSLDGRSTSDIDILVPESRLLEARAILRDNGYAPSSDVRPGIEEHSFHGVPFIRTLPSRMFVVELHWKLSNPRFVTVNYDDLWARMLSARGDSDGPYTLPTADTLLHLALHMPKHSAGALRLLADIDRLVRREATALDWTRLECRADSWGVRHALYFALLRSQTFLGTPLPPQVLQRLAPSPWRSAFVHLVAGPRMLLHPPAQPFLRHTRLQLAHCAMQMPLQRTLDAYAHYLLAPGKLRGSGTCASVSGRVLGGLRGLAWTVIAVGSAVVDGLCTPAVPTRPKPVQGMYSSHA